MKLSRPMHSDGRIEHFRESEAPFNFRVSSSFLSKPRLSKIKYRLIASEDSGGESDSSSEEEDDY